MAGSESNGEKGDGLVYCCLRTMETVGPDDTFAHPHACLSGRGCFEAPE